MKIESATGMGKTRLLQEMKNVAEKKKVRYKICIISFKNQFQIKIESLDFELAFTRYDYRDLEQFFW